MPFFGLFGLYRVFHFIPQQYGFMRLYARNEPKKWGSIDNLIIYTATAIPCCFGFIAYEKVQLFVANEFLSDLKVRFARKTIGFMR
jgi:hypothetical protein